MTPVELREILDYDPLTGVVRNKRTKRPLLPDHDGLVNVFCKKSYKMKLERIAYTLGYGKEPGDDKKVLHKNLDISDNSLNNLTLVTRRVFLQIKEAQKNLTQGIRISAHPTDQFNYVVHWVENSFEKQKVVCDIAKARQIMLKLQLKYSKILTKYCIFD